ncbi:hypothetical protein DASC09_054970 [Saccharomycopsis crataegensis]|uniref:Major facilitator superfamily (MFS) profile domain-containing protein n=1 Tax=Saccharomycopsis crataegensis TaxID=43959 RepID=A0AAV5QVK9_9ASCO|nr:hypothetical protein DASC09_054970 [Saccharomycopsis crataegensis]
MSSKKIRSYQLQEDDEINESSVFLRSNPASTSDEEESLQVQTFEAPISQHDEDEDYYINLSESKVLAHKKENLFKITLVSMMFFTAFGAAMSPLVTLQISKICRDLFSYGPDGNTNSTGLYYTHNCDAVKAQQVNSRVQSMFLILACLLAMLTAGKVGQLSDVHGRKKILSICLSFVALQASLMAFLLGDHVPFNFYVFVIAKSLDGAVGGIKAIIGIFRTYTIDLADPKDRVASLSVVGGSVYFGFAVGPIISAFISKVSGGNDFYILYFEIIGILLTVIFLVIFVPETHYSHLKHHPRSSKSIFHTFKCIKLFYIPESRPRRIKVLLVLVINLIISGTLQTAGQAIVLWSTLKFHWGTAEIGSSLSFMGACRVINSFVTAPAYMKLLRSGGYISNSIESHNGLTKVDIFNIQFASVVTLLEVLIVLYADSEKWLYLAMAVGSFNVLSGSTIQTALVKLCHENITSHGDIEGGASDTKTGELFGALSLLETLFIMLMGSVVMITFSKTASTNPNFCFMLLFLMVLFAVVCGFFLIPDDGDDSIREDYEEQE